MRGFCWFSFLNDEKVASSYKYTHIKVREQTPYPINDQNGRNQLQFLFGDGWDCEEEFDVLAALALRLDIKIGFPGVYFTEQKARVKKKALPFRRWPNKYCLMKTVNDFAF